MAIEEVAALRERDRMRAGGLHVLEAIADAAEQAVLDGEIRLRRREHASLQQQIVVDPDRADDAVLDGDEAAVNLARLDRVEDLLAERESHRLDVAEPRQQRRLAVGAPDALERDSHAPISAERPLLLKPSASGLLEFRRRRPIRDYSRGRERPAAPPESTPGALRESRL